MNLIIIVFVLLSIHYYYFLMRINNGLNRLKSQQTGTGLKRRSNWPDEFVSIIIPFRNESNNVLKSLESMDRQNFPKDKFEIIYVNDCSDDDSLEKLMKAKKPINVKVISVPDTYSRQAFKKRAIKYGLENSKGNIIVSTDCDCIHNEGWLESMLSLYDEDTAFISGPVRFLSDGKIFSKFQILEFAGLILTGAGLISIEKPVICNAANLSYRKNVFDEVQGFCDNMELSSGDDEFLMQKIASMTSYKIKFNMDTKAVALTNPNDNISQFFQQRKRWASKGLFYNDRMLKIKLILIFFFYASLIFQLLSGILISKIYLVTFLIFFTIKILVELAVMIKGVGLLFEKKLLWFLLPAEMLQIPYIIAASIAGVRGNFTWKDRKLRR